MAKDYTKLKELLMAQEKFPIDYLHKFIGKNSPQFATSVATFERKFPGIKLTSSKMSKGDAHVALTYVFQAYDADSVVELLKATDIIEDILVIL